MPGWFRWLLVSNDGTHVVTGYDGLNLIPINYAEDTVMFTFWAKGKEIRRVRLKEIIPSKSVLTRTMSHYEWGTIERIDEKNRLVVRRADGKALFFDVATGIQQ